MMKGNHLLLLFKNAAVAALWSQTLVRKYVAGTNSEYNARLYFPLNNEESRLDSCSCVCWDHGELFLHRTTNVVNCQASEVSASGDLFCTYLLLLGRSNQGEWGGRGMWHAWDRRGKCTGFGGKARRKDTTWKTKEEMRGWDQNGS
jgi:hypothetical protein